MSLTSAVISLRCDETVDARSAIVGLRNSSNLDPGCLYTADDINWVVAGGAAGRFTAVATSEDTLSSHGFYESDLTNPGEPWEASLDWDTGRIYFMKDAHIRENEVHGDLEVSRFPWATNDVRRTLVRYSNFLYTSGRVDNVSIINNADVRIDGGSITDTIVMSNGQIRQTGNSTITDTTVQSDGRLYISTDGARVRDVTVSNETTLDIRGACTIEESTHTESSIVYLDGGTHYKFNVGNESYVDARGWSGNFRQLNLSRYDYRVTGTGTVSESDLKGLGYVRLRDMVNLNIYDLHSSGYGYLIADRAQNFRLRYTGFEGIGYIYGEDSVNTTIERSNLEGNGIFNVRQANGLVLYRCKAKRSGNLVATRGAGRIDAVEISDVVTVRLDDATGIDFDQVKFQTGCYADLRNAVSPLLRELTYSNNATLYASGSTNLRIRYGSVSRTNVYARNSTRVYFENPELSGGFIDWDGATDNTLSYLSSLGYNYARAENAPQGRINRVSLLGYGLLRVQGNVAAGWGISDTDIKSRSDVRIESAGRIRESSFSARAIFTARHTGDIRRAVVMQRVHTQTTPVNDLRLHQGGTF